MTALLAFPVALKDRAARYFLCLAQESKPDVMPVDIEMLLCIQSFRSQLKTKECAD